jgi:hypothetical protein
MYFLYFHIYYTHMICIYFQFNKYVIILIQDISMVLLKYNKAYIYLTINF